MSTLVEAGPSSGPQPSTAPLDLNQAVHVARFVAEVVEDCRACRLELGTLCGQVAGALQEAVTAIGELNADDQELQNWVKTSSAITVSTG